MAKWAFEDNVPKVRPRLRLGRTEEQVVDAVTEPPPVRSRAEPAIDTEAASEPVTPSEAPATRRSAIRNILETADEAAAELAPEPTFESEELTPQAETVTTEEVAASLEPVLPQEEPPPSIPARASQMPVPAVGDAESLLDDDEEEPAPELPKAVAAPAPKAEKPAEKPPEKPVVSAIEEAEAATRRAQIKRRAAGLGALPEAPTPLPTAFLEDLDALESTAELATELERALAEAAEANEQLRGDLNAALDDLARSTSESKRLHERVERLDAEARDRTKVVQDLMREMELLEGERDSALVQASDAQLEIESFGEKMMLIERRTQELERSLAEAQARNKRFEEAVQAHAAQRAALRAELEAMRRERDSLVARNAELEREKEDLGRSRKALDEVHRALTEARMRAQRIRGR